MFKQIELAIESEEYSKAEDLLQELMKSEADSLWLRYYQALIKEKQENFIDAERDYRQVIKDSIYPDIALIKLIRDGIERIAKANREKEQKILEEYTNTNNSQDLAVLILEPVPLDEKKNLAIKLAKTMKIDNYSAMLQIPIRGWKIYKTGYFGELNYYQNKLYREGISCFCYSLKDVNKMIIYQVKYFQVQGNEVIFFCNNKEQKEINLIISWGRIKNKVRGLVPIFEMTTHTDARNKVRKKQSTLDYVTFLDFHLPEDNLILRFNDYSYEFDRDSNLESKSITAKEKWKELVTFIDEKTFFAKTFSDFTLFAEGATQFPEMLKQITSYVNLFRREESLWDEAFQLYSGLIFLRYNQ